MFSTDKLLKFKSGGKAKDQGVGVGNDKLENGESLVINFNLAKLPYGAENLILTMAKFGGDDAVDITVYDIDGNTLASFPHSAGKWLGDRFIRLQRHRLSPDRPQQ